MFPFETKLRKGVQVPLLNCAPCRAKVVAKVTKYNNTPKGKVNTHKSNTSAKGKERFKRFDGSTKGRQRIVRGRNSVKGKATKKRLLKRQRDDKGLRLAQSLRDALSRLWHDRINNTPILFRHTEFTSKADVVAHLTQFVPPGVPIAVAREQLQIEHNIPVKEYDHNILENVRRCHSKRNLRLLPADANDEKHIKVIRAICVDVGVEVWPVGWGGVIPGHAV